MRIDEHYCKPLIYECKFDPKGQGYEFSSDEILKIGDACVYNGKFIVVTKVKSMLQKKFNGDLVKISKYKI